ncbi:hypothetical protein ACFLU4_02670 [Chloroflexota bacterium]
MRKLFGWLLFLLAGFDFGIIFYNLVLAPWKDDLTLISWRALPYLAVLGLSLFGWYRLAIRKPKGD